MFESMKLKVSLAMLVMMLSAAARSDELCPSKIETQQILKVMISGWKAGTLDVITHFAEVAISNGPPGELKFISPMTKGNADGSTTLTWLLEPSEQYWLQCQYGNTTVTISKALSKGTKRCDVGISRLGFLVSGQCL
jgi:hypothetical protein